MLTFTVVIVPFPAVDEGRNLPTDWRITVRHSDDSEVNARIWAELLADALTRRLGSLLHEGQAMRVESLTADESE